MGRSLDFNPRPAALARTRHMSMVCRTTAMCTSGPRLGGRSSSVAVVHYHPVLVVSLLPLRFVRPAQKAEGPDAQMSLSIHNIQGI